MHIKRNLTKFTPDSSEEIYTGTGLSKYKYPKDLDVSPGIYFSKIKSARKASTYSGRKAIEVFYIIKDAYVCSRIMNNLPYDEKKNKTYKIKQLYTVGTVYYEAFMDAMIDALGEKSFTLKDLTSLTELITIGYDTKSSFGSIIDRHYYEESDFIKPLKEDKDDDYDDDTFVEEEETPPPSNDSSPSEDSIIYNEKEPVIEDEEENDNKGRILDRKRGPVSRGPLGTRRPIRDKEPVKKEIPPANAYDDDDEFDDFLPDDEGDDSLDW